MLALIFQSRKVQTTQQTSKIKVNCSYLFSSIYFPYLCSSFSFFLFFIVLSFYSTCKFPRFNNFTRPVSRRFNLFKCRKVHNKQQTPTFLSLKKLFLFVVFYLFSFIASYLYFRKWLLFHSSCAPVCGKTTFFRRFSYSEI